eukprot:CAMPEP_0197034052 /NCGR_PEP_ID=MMETSP1384-20130603/12274_1 /TAXON_ID=29189 /ORGANISM="Ammonia sp." /LENGTH=67 /DNA_ID=CAMNT_0042463929 /DNA_START=71 /DNA_END=271 /DNA_ORIENTATION=+
MSSRNRKRKLSDIQAAPDANDKNHAEPKSKRRKLSISRGDQHYDKSQSVEPFESAKNTSSSSTNMVS